MCGRYYIDDETSKEIEKIVANLDKKLNYQKGEVRPTNNALILTGKNQRIEPKVFKWGFPKFTDSGVILNARADTVFEKRTFKDSIISRRCIIPASGFFEWNKIKEKVYFTPKSKKIMYMAGIYNIFENETRFVILTTKANTSVKEVHDRMPLLLNENQIDEWIFESMRTSAILKQVPYILNYQIDYEQQSLNLNKPG